MHKLLLILLLLFISDIHAQTDYKIDSLIMLIAEETIDTLQVQYLNEIAKNYYRNYPDTAINYAREALKKSEMIDYAIGMSKANRLIGLSYAGKAEYDTALHYLFISLQDAKRAKDISYYASILTSIGIVYRKLSEYDKALQYYLNTLRLVKIEGDPSKISSALNNVGIIYKITGDFDEAVKYYSESLEINHNEGNKQGAAFNYGNLGMIYKDMNDLENAELYLKNALELFLEFNYKNEIGHAYLALGEIYMEKQECEQAFDLIQKANKIYSETENKAGIAESYIILGEIYFMQNKLNPAESALTLGLKLAQEVGNKEFIIDSYLYLFKLDSAKGNYENALYNYQKYSMLKDSVFSKEKNKIITNITQKYNLQEKERENTILKKDKEIQASKLKRQKTINLFAVILIFMLVFLFAIIIFSYKRLRKVNNELLSKNEEIISQNMILTEYKEEINSQYEEISVQNEKLESYKNKLESIVEQRTKELNAALVEARNSDRLKTQFLENLSHEVRTPMNAVTGISDLISRGEMNFKPEYILAVRRSMDDLMNTIDRLVLISKFQMDSYELNIEKIDLKKFINELKIRTEERREFLEKEDILIEFKSDFENLPEYFLSDIFIIESVLKELIENALKFTEKGNVSVSIKYSENQILIKVRDTGVGIKEEMKNHVYELMRKFDKEGALYRGMGVGLTMVKKAVDLLSGNINIDSVYNEGAEISVTFPETKSFKIS